MNIITKKNYNEIKQKYIEDGFVGGINVFNKKEASSLIDGFTNLSKLLKPGETLNYIVQWHVKSKWIYDLCTHPGILDLVEDIIGPDFYLWDTQLFAKAPHRDQSIAWHQDAFYANLNPSNYVTVFLAIVEMDEENGALTFIPKTHLNGLLPHYQIPNSPIYEVNKELIENSAKVQLKYKTGEFSIHNPLIIHGSPGNNSSRIRLGFAIRYAPCNVKIDTKNFVSFLVRGKDKYKLNTQGEKPTELFGRMENEDIWRHEISKNS